MNKKELIKALESVPDDATICIDGGFVNLIEAGSVDYSPSRNIVVIG